MTSLDSGSEARGEASSKNIDDVPELLPAYRMQSSVVLARGFELPINLRHAHAREQTMYVTTARFFYREIVCASALEIFNEPHLKGGGAR